MNHIQPLKLLFCCAFLLGVPLVLGEDRPHVVAPETVTAGPTNVSRDAANQRVFEELQHIRRKLGGSVLRGSLLDDPALAIEEESNSGMRKVLGLPVRTAQLGVQMTSQQIVKAIRVHCSRVDRIANEIENSRQYASADQLRDTASHLRLIARQLDKPPTDSN